MLRNDSRIQYFKFSPRGFSNEYEIVRTTNADEREAMWECYRHCRNRNASLDRVTTIEIRRLARQERFRRKWGVALSGNCSPWVSVSVEEFIRAMKEKEAC